MLPEIVLFREWFKNFEKHYVIIGGMACDILMSEAGVPFRSTKDIDMVLVIEALSIEFIAAFWKFIESGQYQITETNNGKPVFYRFQKPSNPAFPKMIELFSIPDMNSQLSCRKRLLPIVINSEIQSLSAILLDSDYYQLIRNGQKLVDGLSVLSATHLIPLKMKAWIDLSTRKKSGELIDERNIKKHKLDVFRLFNLLTGKEKTYVPQSVLNDIHDWITAFRDIPIDLKQLNIKRNQKFILDVFQRIYVSE